MNLRGASSTDHAGGCPGEAHHAVFCRHVGRRRGEADVAQYRAHVDDGAAARCEHRRDLVLHAIKDPREVDFEHAAPAFDAVVCGRVRLAADAGVVARTVEPSEMVEGYPDEGLARQRIGYVGTDKDGLAARLFDEPGRVSPVFLVHVGDDNESACV